MSTVPEVKLPLHTLYMNREFEIVSSLKFVGCRVSCFYHCSFLFFKLLEQSILDISLTNIPSDFILRNCPLPYKASKKSPRFAPQFLQNCKGYKGWRFICTTREFFIKWSINFVVNETMLDIFKGKETANLYKGRAC